MKSASVRSRYILVSVHIRVSIAAFKSTKSLRKRGSLLVSSHSPCQKAWLRCHVVASKMQGWSSSRVPLAADHPSWINQARKMEFGTSCDIAISSSNATPERRDRSIERVQPIGSMLPTEATSYWPRSLPAKVASVAKAVMVEL